MDNPVVFTITKYIEGDYKIETKHMAYHFKDGLFINDISADQIPKAMEQITDIMNNKYGAGAVFEIDF